MEWHTRLAPGRCLALLLGALALAGCEREPPVVTDHDKAVVVRAGDLARFGWNFANPAPHEKFAKHVSWDGSYTLEYEFETPQTEVDQPLYLGVFISVERTASDAIFTQQAERLGFNIGLRGEDIQARKVEGFHPGASFEILELDGQPVGNLFSMREGKKVYTLILSGFYFDDPMEWKALVDDKLRRFVAGPPAPAPARPH